MQPSCIWAALPTGVEQVATLFHLGGYTDWSGTGCNSLPFGRLYRLKWSQRAEEKAEKPTHLLQSLPSNGDGDSISSYETNWYRSI